MVRAGIIGCGVMGGIHAQSLQISGAGKPVSFYDASYERAQELAVMFKGKAHRKLEDLLDEDGLDCIYICTQHDSHLYMVEQAITRQKPIFCEKPLAAALQDSICIRDLISESRQPFFVGFNQRYSPGAIRLKKMIKQFTPTVINLSLSCCDFLHLWMGKPVVGGGVLPSLAVHAFDILRYILDDEFDYIGCLADRLRLGEGYLEDCGTVSFKLKSGALGGMTFHDHSNLNYQKDPGMNMYDLEIHTKEHSTLVCNLNKEISVYTPEKVYKEEFGPYDILYSWGYISMNKAFIDVITDHNAEPYPTADDGLKAARLIDAASRSNKKKIYIKCDGF